MDDHIIEGESLNGPFCECFFFGFVFAVDVGECKVFEDIFVGAFHIEECATVHSDIIKRYVVTLRERHIIPVLFLIELRPIDVKGSWVKVKTTDGKHEGWIESDWLCGNSLTNCC